MPVIKLTGTVVTVILLFFIRTKYERLFNNSRCVFMVLVSNLQRTKNFLPHEPIFNSKFVNNLYAFSIAISSIENFVQRCEEDRYKYLSLGYKTVVVMRIVGNLIYNLIIKIGIVKIGKFVFKFITEVK